MQLHFNTVSEPGLPGAKWQKLYETHRRAYLAWIKSKPNLRASDLQTSQAALKKYMPELWPTYERLCKLAGADDVEARFLTGFQPPAYSSACSNALTTGDEIQLVRNYDYHPDLVEGTQLLSAWNGKKVIATTDCLIGALDGMNEDGLAISLTFGGRKTVGTGFGIPVILRYVLEFCSNVEEAVAALVRIPSHMSYNVTVVDKSGKFKTVQLAPDKQPLVTDAAYTTNHQESIDWPENAAFNKTLERSAFLENLLARKDVDARSIADSFLQKPLYNTSFKEGFGTLFTAVYKPAEGIVEMRWPQVTVRQSFADFRELYKLISYEPVAVQPSIPVELESDVIFQKLVRKRAAVPLDRQEMLADPPVRAMSCSNSSASADQLQELREILATRGQNFREVLSNFASKPLEEFSDTRKSK